jgi:DNA-binding transcriptional LysR family regulator
VDALRKAFAERGLPAPQIAVEVNSMAFRRRLLASSQLLTLGPRRFFQDGAWRSRLTELMVKDFSSRRRIGVCYRKDAYLSPAVRRFIGILKETAKEIGGST